MRNVRVGVGEMDEGLLPGTDGWSRLIESLGRAEPDLFVLNELSFGPWIATSPEFDRETWERSVADSEAGVDALGELGVPVVVGSRAVERDGRRLNEAYVWTADEGARPVHTKQHIPNSNPNYWEAVWYQPGELCFEVVSAASLRLGFLLCTDLMFPEHARQYGRQGTHLIIGSRAMPPSAANTFDVALKMAAIVSGCYVASSNRTGRDAAGHAFEGRGCIVDPQGRVVAQTSSFDRVVVHDVSTEFVDWKQSVYPCDVE